MAPEVEMIPREYRRRVVTVDANAVRSFATSVIQRWTAGYLVDRRSSAVLPTFPGDAQMAELFLAQWAPTDEQRSEPYLRYEMFTPRYVVLRDLDTFDLRENARLGPSLSMRVAYGLPALGASFRAIPLGAGHHTLTLEYAPRSVMIGLWMSAIAWIGLLFAVSGHLIRRRLARRVAGP